MPINILANKRILLGVLAGAVLCFAQDISKDWSLSFKEDAVIAYYTKDSKIKVPLVAEAGDPKLISWETIPERKNVWALRYFAGSSGTSVIIESYRQILIEMPSGKILIDLPYEYKVMGLSPKEQKRVAQPKWEWSKRGLKVTDKDYSSNNVFLVYETQN